VTDRADELLARFLAEVTERPGGALVTLTAATGHARAAVAHEWRTAGTRCNEPFHEPLPRATRFAQCEVAHVAHGSGGDT